jgi:outer membrane protein assembly factor BamB
MRLALTLLMTASLLVAHEGGRRNTTPTKADKDLKQAQAKLAAAKKTLQAKGRYACCVKPSCDLCMRKNGSCACAANVMRGLGACGECMAGWKSGRGSLPGIKAENVKLLPAEKQAMPGTGELPPELKEGLTALLAATVPWIGSARADWPGWRGPNRDGRATEALPRTLRAEAEPMWKLAIGRGYSGPVVASNTLVYVDEQQGSETAHALDRATGRELWRVEERAQHSASERPLFWRGTAFFQSGFKGQILAVKLGGSGVLEESQLAWRVKKGVPSKPSMLLIDGLLYMVDDSGIASCVDATSGEVVWSERIGGNFSASPVYADGRVYALNEEGKVTTFAAEKTFRKIGEGQFEAGFMASPAVAGNALYLRSKTHLYRVEKGR